jgi:hypothetical protein
MKLDEEKKEIEGRSVASKVNTVKRPLQRRN